MIGMNHHLSHRLSSVRSIKTVLDQTLKNPIRRMKKIKLKVLIFEGCHLYSDDLLMLGNASSRINFQTINLSNHNNLAISNTRFPNINVAN